jgi:RecA-family ATPase
MAIPRDWSYCAESSPPAPRKSTSLSLRDTPMLEDALERTQARLLIIDPLHSYLWAVDRHRANESGRAFGNLARLAEKHRCCILLVRHLRKRGAGQASIELSSAIRTEFLAGSSPDAPTRPALV